MTDHAPKTEPQGHTASPLLADPRHVHRQASFQDVVHLIWVVLEVGPREWLGASPRTICPEALLSTESNGPPTPLTL